MNLHDNQDKEIDLRTVEQYKHTQIGYLLLISYSVVALGIAFLNIAAAFHPLAVTLLIILLIVLGIFSRLTVTIDDQTIKIQFGLRVIRKAFPLKEIDAYRVVKNPWYYGWGIRFTPRGWLFNVSGFSAIELQMKSGKRYRIGTDDPDNLAKALGKALHDNPDA